MFFFFHLPSSFFFLCFLIFLFLVRYLFTCPPPQVLGSSSKSGGLSAKLHEVHHQFALSPLPLHCGLCFVGDAAVWRTVSINSNLKRSSHLCIYFVFLSVSVYVIFMESHVFLFFSDSTLKMEPLLRTLTHLQQRS